MNATCETCQHWDPNEYPRARRADAETMEGEPGRWGVCTLLSDDDRSSRSERAFTRDSSDYKSWLMVRSDFGCAEHAQP